MSTPNPPSKRYAVAQTAKEVLDVVHLAIARRRPAQLDLIDPDNTSFSKHVIFRIRNSEHSEDGTHLFIGVIVGGEDDYRTINVYLNADQSVTVRLATPN